MIAWDAGDTPTGGSGIGGGGWENLRRLSCVWGSSGADAAHSMAYGVRILL